MSRTPAPTPPLAANRPVAPPPKPAPSRTPYRPAPDTTFSAALRAAANEAMMAQLTMANPSAARIGALPDAGMAMPGAGMMPGIGAMPGAGMMPGAGLPMAEMQPPPGVDARLWESLIRGAPLNLAAGNTIAPPGAVETAALAARSEPVAPVAQAISPAVIREKQQAFLSSIDGFDQTAVGEYENVGQARAWGYSTCSAASLTAVLRAAGQDVKIADVMKAMPGGMTIKLGLVSRPSLVNAANQFGGKATDDVTSYEALKQATENGQPVLVDIRNGKFPEGHWIVVTGVDENGIRCADSSRHDLTSIPRGEFQRSWSSRGIRLEGFTPTAPTAAPARPGVRSA